MRKKENNFSAGGHLDDNTTALYVDGLLNEKQAGLPEEVLTHVETCGDCKEKVFDLFLFLKQSGSGRPAPAKPEILEMRPKRTGRYYPVRVAALFFTLALMLTAYFLIQDKDSFLGKYFPDSGSVQGGVETPGEKNDVPKVPGDVQNPAHQGDVAKPGSEPGDTNVTPPSYRVNPNLENMIGSNLRSGNLEILSPANNARFRGEITFSWEEFDQKPLYLKILNNHNVVLYMYSLEGNRFLFTEVLRGGLYYWKLESDSDLLYVGKFKIY